MFCGPIVLWRFHKTVKSLAARSHDILPYHHQVCTMIATLGFRSYDYNTSTKTESSSMAVFEEYVNPSKNKRNPANKIKSLILKEVIAVKQTG